MKYTKEQYQKLADKFNSYKITGKLFLIKNHPDIFKLECDNGWYMLRLNDEEAMQQELDFLFKFPNELDSRDINAVFDLAGIKIW